MAIALIRECGCATNFRGGQSVTRYADIQSAIDLRFDLKNEMIPTHSRPDALDSSVGVGLGGFGLQNSIVSQFLIGGFHGI